MKEKDDDDDEKEGEQQEDHSSNKVFGMPESKDTSVKWVLIT